MSQCDGLTKHPLRVRFEELTMRNPVISSAYQLPMGNDGSIAIVGHIGNHVIFLVSGASNVWTDLDISSFADRSAPTPVFGNAGEAFVFCCALRGPIRNPQRLLYKIRRNLNKAIRKEEARFDQEMADQDHLMSMAVHLPNNRRI